MVAAVYAAEAKVESARVKRNKARAAADTWVDGAACLLDRARADLVPISGVDRAAFLLGVGKPNCANLWRRRSVKTA